MPPVLKIKVLNAVARMLPFEVKTPVEGIKMAFQPLSVSASIRPTRILVIGSGGREHAMVWKLAQSPHATP